jgi:hypothetical protein
MNKPFAWAWLANARAIGSFAGRLDAVKESSRARAAASV